VECKKTKSNYNGMEAHSYIYPKTCVAVPHFKEQSSMSTTPKCAAGCLLILW
jgi:hypothetical protein